MLVVSYRLNEDHVMLIRIQQNYGACGILIIMAVVVCKILLIWYNYWMGWPTDRPVL